jgi:hypothetical protein
MADFGVTPEGFKAKKFSDLMEDSAESLKLSLGLEIDTKPNSVAKVLTSTYNLALSELWAAQQAQQSMFDISKAEGTHLDNLVGYVRMQRLEASASYGNVYLSVKTPELLIPAGSTFTDTSGNDYTSNVDTSSGLSYAVSLVVDVEPTATAGTILSLSIDGLNFSETITNSIPNAVTNLVAAINIQTPTTNFIATDISEGVLAKISIDKQEDAVSTVTSILSGFVLDYVTSIIPVQKTVLDSVPIAAGTITGIPNISNTVSCTNRYDLTVGTGRETDEELRIRHKLLIAVAGKSTVDAITSALYQSEGVRVVQVIENDDMLEDENGIPPKSIHCVVQGGVDIAIAAVIWDNKPAGISTFGDKVVVTSDSQNNTKYIYFSRPELIYIHANIDYTLYAEESNLFPAEGESDIMDIVVAYGENLALGEDIIPQRFETEIMKQIEGLATVTVTFGVTAAPLDATPTLSHQIIPIASAAEAAFVLGRTTIARV